MKGNFLVVDKRVLPEVYEKVIDAKKLLKDGDAKDITEATKKVNLSRSVYYKYKDFVFDFAETKEGKKVTINMIIYDKKGVLSDILNYIFNEGGNIITINQGIPINEKANVTFTIDVTTLKSDIQNFMESLNNLKQVEKVELIAME